MNASLPVLAALCILLSGCIAPYEVQPPPTPDAQRVQWQWQQHQARMAGISAWNVNGKIAVQSGRKGGSATLRWEYQPPREQIEIYGPFGGGRVQITVQPERAILKDSKGNTIEADTAAHALYQRLGWRVPFAQLHNWVRGLPAERAPGEQAPQITLDTAGRLRTLQQSRWLVEYQQYQTIHQLELPHTLSLVSQPGDLEVYSRHGEYIGDSLSVKIILRRWQDLQVAE